MPPRPLLLTSANMALACGGYWENLPAQALTLTGISLDKTTTQPGDLYIRLRTERAAAGIKQAVQNGAVAAVVNHKADLSELGIPLLRVADPEQALQQLAAATREASAAKKVLVTGSYGKTGFKTQLYHVLKGQLSCHAILNSNNSLKAIWKSLATLRPDDALTIIEAAVPSPSRGAIVSNFVQPHLAVITWIGHEHLKQHGGTQDHLIANKAKIVLGLPPQGTVLIPQQAGILERLQAAILALRPDVKLRVFGDNDTCHAQLLQATFDHPNWLIKARIGETLLDYTLPLWEAYAPLSSVSVLLAVQALDGDVAAAAKRFTSYQHFQSSGHFYELEKDGNRFFLYDQSTRIGLEAFKSTLQLIATLKPKRQGKKIAVFTEFYSLDKAPRSILDEQAFQDLFRASGLDCLYTAAHFPEHLNVLADKSIWKNHSYTISNLMDEIIDAIQADDMLFVRGAVADGEVGLDQLVARLLKECTLLKIFY